MGAGKPSASLQQEADGAEFAGSGHAVKSKGLSWIPFSPTAVVLRQELHMTPGRPEHLVRPTTMSHS